MFLLMLLLIADPIGAQLPSEVVLDSVYSGQNSTHSIEYHLKVDVNTADTAGSFKSQVAVKIAGADSLWALNLQVQAVSPFPAEIDFGEIDFTTLPLEHHLSLAQIADQPLAIDSVAVQGEGVVAYPTDAGTGLLIRTDEALTWGRRIDGLVEVHLAGNDRTLLQTVHVEGKVLDRFQVDPPALSFGMGKPHRRQVKTVAVRVAPDAARAPVRVQSKCPAPTFAFERKAHEVEPRKKFYLLADIPEFHSPPERASRGYHYVGPLLDAPKEKGTISLLDQGWDLSWPLVYVTCGSSGRPPEYLEGLIEAVAHESIRLFVTTAGRWDGTSHYSNVRVTDFLPGEWVLQQARALVGIVGIGAIYQALRCGVPIIGAPEHLDQEYHLNRVEQLGLGIKLDRKAFRADEILTALYRVMGDDSQFATSCRAFAKTASQWHGGQVATDLIDGFFLAQEKPYQLDSRYAMEKREFVRYLVASTPLSTEDIEAILHEGTGRGLPHHKVHGALYYDRIDSWNWLYDQEPRFFEADYRALEQKRNRFFIRDEKGIRGRKKWQRYRMTYQLRIDPAPLQPGQHTRIFLPYPIEGGGQRDIQYIACKPADMEAVLVPAMGFFYNYELTKGSAESGPWELSYVCELTVEEFPSANGFQPVPLSPIERKRYLSLDPALANCPEVEGFRQELGPRKGRNNECRARALYEALMHTKRFKKTKDPTQSIGYSTQAILGDTGGHCITLSRAFMALCRLDGIPVREVAGALIGYPNGDDSFALDTYREPIFGHTWTEVHLAEKGWVPVEFHGIVIGQTALTDHNVADPALRHLIKENTNPYWAYYFGHLDTQRIRCSNSVKRIPQCLVERPDAQANDPNRWDFQTELSYECHLQIEILDEG